MQMSIYCEIFCSRHWKFQQAHGAIGPIALYFQRANVENLFKETGVLRISPDTPLK